MESKSRLIIANSWFGQYAHRNPDAALPMMYAMACIEIVTSQLRKQKEFFKILKHLGKTIH
jgi:hypothetical protein